uniref:Uncharacterized protein n=1 Tax=Arundo donax TaxID=35708 RepID=A0A0A9BH17_ARUDO
MPCQSISSYSYVLLLYYFPLYLSHVTMDTYVMDYFKKVVWTRE